MFPDLARYLLIANRSNRRRYGRPLSRSSLTMSSPLERVAAGPAKLVRDAGPPARMARPPETVGPPQRIEMKFEMNGPGARLRVTAPSPTCARTSSTTCSPTSTLVPGLMP